MDKRKQIANVPSKLSHLPWLGLLACLCALPVSAAIAAGAVTTTTPAEPLATIVQLVNGGQFKAADAQIAVALQNPELPAAERKALHFQRVRMQRIAYDFDLTADEVEAKVRKKIPGLTEAEFARWNAHGLFEHKVIDGKLWYFRRSPSNLFDLSSEARKLAKLPPDTDDWSSYDTKVVHAALSSGHTGVMPQRVQVTQSLVVDADAVPAGKTIRAWIPYPQAIPGQQEGIEFISSVPSRHRVAPKAAKQRTVYLEKAAQAGKPTTFSITYQVTLYAQYHPIDPDKVVPAKITPALAPYVAERAPHIVFTEPLRVFSHQIVGDTTNPYRIAQKLFAAVDDVPWAGAREYSTIPDISMYTLDAGHGDCGEQTLLLMTLLRMNGIPARWQSGWTFTKSSYSDIHDWAQIYLAPYGWVPVDVTYGRLDSKDPAVKWFYLGGLDNFRIAFNNGYGDKFVPAKQHFRSDTVDSQRGEVEWDGGNLYYDKWSYHFHWKILPAKQTAAK
ncbi:MAG: transglutaminase-like domain-containing protein [Rhodanobacteraceae bacterium]